MRESDVIEPLVEVSPEVKRRLIRRSMRCLALGWIGLTPIFGAGLAIMAVRLHRTALSEAGELHSHCRIRTFLFLGAFLSAAVAVFDRVPLAVLLGSLFLLLQFNYLREQANSTGAPPSVNPLRRQLFTGAILGYAGLFFSCSLLATLILAVLKEL